MPSTLNPELMAARPPQPWRRIRGLLQFLTRWRRCGQREPQGARDSLNNWVGSMYLQTEMARQHARYQQKLRREQRHG